MHNPFEWHPKTFLSAAKWREEADKYERLAKMAEADGDKFHAERARRNAAQCRENARIKEIDNG
ncbi:MAG: hypothetical protein ACK4WM_04845 [Thermoflexales bacterium]